METAQELIRRYSGLTDDGLFAELAEKTVGEREHLVKTLVILSVLDARKAAVPRGSPSLYKYCTSRLGYCERTAYRRVAAARAGRRCPIILEKLRSGAVHLSAVVLLADHFTESNVESLLRKASGATLDELKRLAASLSPVSSPPPERTRVIAVVQRGAVFGGVEPDRPPGGVEPDQPPGGLESDPPPGGAESGRLPEGSVQPGKPAVLAAEAIAYRTEHQFTLGDAAEAKLKRARELLSHRFPAGDIESIFEAALDSLLDAVDPARRAARPPSKPRAADEESRRIPEWVKRRVRSRDADRCAFVSADGARCGERRFLQFDHIVPWSLGGRSDDPKNVRQLCGAHNRWAWRHAFVTRC